MIERDSETEPFRLSDLEQGLAILRRVRDGGEASSTAEKMNAIKEIARLTGQEVDGAGPGGMSRSELQSELIRVRAQITAQMDSKA